MEDQETKLCSKCQESKPLLAFSKDKHAKDGLATRCRECKNAGFKKWSVENNQKYRAIRVAYVEANRDKERERCRRYDTENRERRRAAAKTRREQFDRERLDALAEKQRKYREENLELVRSNDQPTRQTSRAKIYGVSGTVTKSEWLALKEKYDNRCLCCGEKKTPLCMDHVISMSKGGSNTIDNIQPLCFSCNSSKRSKETDFRKTWEIAQSLAP